MNKVCNICNVSYTLNNFYKRYTKKGTLYYRASCKRCTKAQLYKYRDANKELIKQIAKNTYQKYKDKRLKKNKEYYKKNRDKLIKQALEYQKAHKYKTNAKNRRYKLNKLSRTFNTCQNAINKIYRLCGLLNKFSSKRYHVDHIVPLHGTMVSGLHVPWNLQIITAEENYRKSNTWVIK